MSLFGLSPTLFWSALGLASAVALALHFLRVRSPEVLVPTVVFWREVVKERAPRMLWRRLSRWGTLLLVLVALGLILFSAKAPVVDPAKARHEVLLVDPAALSLAPAKADLLATLREKDLAGPTLRRALLLAVTPPRILVGFDDPPGSMTQALAAVPETIAFVQADWTRALTQAGAMLTTRNAPGVTAFLLAPATFPSAAAAICGAPVEKKALTAPLWDDGLTASTPVFDPDGRAVVMVQASRQGPGGGIRDLVIKCNGVELDSAPLADESGPVQVWATGLTPGAVVTARLSGSDSVAANDRLDIVVPQRPQVKVHASTPGPALTAALDACERVVLVGDREKADLLVLTGAVPPTGSSRPCLFFTPPPKTMVGPFLRVVKSHPLTRGLAFHGVRASDRTGLSCAPGEVALIRAGGKPVLVLGPGLLRCGLDPGDPVSGLAESPDFPRLISRAIHWLGRGIMVDPAAWAGRWLGFSRGGSAPVVSGRDEGSSTLSIPLAQGRGEWLVRRSGPVALGGDSKLIIPGGGPPLAASPPKSPPAIPAQPAAGSALPGYLLGLALLLLLVEWWALHRGRIA